MRGQPRCAGLDVMVTGKWWGWWWGDSSEWGQNKVLQSGCSRQTNTSMEPGIIVRVIKVGQRTATPSSILFFGDQVKNVFSKSDSQSIRPLLEEVLLRCRHLILELILICIFGSFLNYLRVLWVVLISTIMSREVWTGSGPLHYCTAMLSALFFRQART